MPKHVIPRTFPMAFLYKTQGCRDQKTKKKGFPKTVLKIYYFFQHSKRQKRQIGQTIFSGKQCIKRQMATLALIRPPTLKLRCDERMRMSVCVDCMWLRFQRNYVGWLKPRVISLKTQLHAVNAS